MTRDGLFAAATALTGWALEAAFLHVVPPTFPAPRWLLLAVLALGSRGRIFGAMGLGFAWGLALDTVGSTAFGTHAWLLALAGYAAGRVSREMNSDEPLAQAALAAGASLAVGLGTWGLTNLFPPSAGGPPSPGTIVLSAAIDAAVAPAVFWAIAQWTAIWGVDAVESRRAA